MPEFSHFCKLLGRARQDTRWFKVKSDIAPAVVAAAATAFVTYSQQHDAEAFKMSDVTVPALAAVIALAAYWLVVNAGEFVWNLTQAGNRLEIARLTLIAGTASVQPRSELVDELVDFAKEVAVLHAWAVDPKREDVGLEDAVNDWHDRIEPFLDSNFGKQYFVRLHNHREFTFFSGDSRISWSQYRINVRHHLDGDSRRMNEFLAEVSR
jgi:hypothetical protein